MRWLRDILVVVLIVLAVQWWQARDMPSGEAPSLAGPGLKGEPMTLGALRGQPVLVYFWANWCPICRFTSSSIANIAEDHAVMTVASTSGDVAEVEAYLQENGLEMPVMMDESGDLARHWDVYGLPAIFIVDRQGRIDYASMGYSSEIGLRVRMALSD
jgi:peroxiredoxin